MKQPAIIAISVGLILGTLAVSWGFPAWCVGSASVAAGLLCLAYRNWLSLALVLAILTATLRLMVWPLWPPAHDIGRLNGQTIEEPGVVTGTPSTKARRQQAIVHTRRGSFAGRVLLTLPPKPELRPVDSVVVHGRLTAPRNMAGGFDYRAYLAKDRVYATMPQAVITEHTRHSTVTGLLWSVRRDFDDHLSKIFPGQSGSLLRGILLGERADLPADIKADFQRTGLTHVLALSGYNISIVLAVWITLFGRRPAVLVGGLTSVALFVGLVGISASVLRAALMGSFILLSQLAGRPQTALRAVVITGAGLLMLSPWSLRYDVSFDLSFAATLGIILLTPFFHPVFSNLPKLPAEALTATCAASVWASPIIVATFGQLSLVAPLANVVFVPAVPYLMLGGFIATVVSYAAPGIAVVLAYPTILIESYLVAVVGSFARWPLASLNFNHDRAVVALGVLVVNLLIVGYLFWRQLPSEQKKLRWKLISARIRVVNPAANPSEGLGEEKMGMGGHGHRDPVSAVDSGR